MPRLKDKPITLNEQQFIDWLLEVYYYRFMDQGVAPLLTPLQQAAVSVAAGEAFIGQIRAQLTRFELTFPLGKLPGLYHQALRQVSTTPGRIATAS